MEYLIYMNVFGKYTSFEIHKPCKSMDVGSQPQLEEYVQFSPIPTQFKIRLTYSLFTECLKKPRLVKVRARGCGQ